MTLFRAILLLMLLAAKAWPVEVSTNFVDYMIQLNGRQARMIFASSLGTSLVLEDGAKRLGFAGDPFSTSTEVESGGKKFSAPIYVLGDPIKKVPWVLRQAVKVTHPFLYHEFMQLYREVTGNMEGVVGWPEVRDNILVFDSDRHVIRRVEQLPPETAGWLKWRVLPTEALMLEVPLAGGKKGVAYVDTADSRSIMLAPPQWKEWRQAHPAAAMVTHKVWGLPLLVATDHEALADNVEIGPLSVTDAFIEDMDDEAAGRLGEDDPAATTVWSLGMGALSRMDLIVDGSNGWAYVHPRGAAARPAAAKKTKRGAGLAPVEMWKVDSNVQLQADGFFVREGEFKRRHGMFDSAMIDFGRALEINARNARAWSDRGVLLQAGCAFAGAVSNYDKSIELRPDFSEWERLYRQTLLWRLANLPEAEPNSAATPLGGGKTDPKISLEAVEVVGTPLEGLSGVDYGWPKTLGQFLVGRIDEKALIAAAKKSGDAEENKALAYYYIGMRSLSMGDPAGARVWFQKCKNAGQTDSDEYYFSVSELGLLSKSPPGQGAARPKAGR